MEKQRKISTKGTVEGFGETERSLLESMEQKISMSPKLKDLSVEQLEEIAKIVVIKKYADEMAREANILEYDYFEQKGVFLEDMLRCDNTRLAYDKAFLFFEEYFIEKKQVANPLTIDCAMADDYIYYLKGLEYSPNTVRQLITGISSFFSFMARRSNNLIRNPFSGTKARPRKISENNNKFYTFGVNDRVMSDTLADFKTLIDSLKNREFKAIVVLMMELGLRIGAFTSEFSYRGDKFRTFSKGKEIRGTLTSECLAALKDACLPEKETFSNWTDAKSKNDFKYFTKKLFAEGKIRFPYSAHDVRHYFAIDWYRKTKDIHLVSKKLCHSSIMVTEHYLKGLNVLDDPDRPSSGVK